MTIEHAYRPPPLKPLEARFLNLLLTRDLPHSFDLFGTQCSFKADPWQAPFTPACGLDLETGGETWRLLFSSAGFLGLHPTGARIAESPGLPEGLRLALFELALAPVLKALAAYFALDKQPSIVAENIEAPEGCICSIPLLVRLPDESIAASVHISAEASAEAMLRRLNQEKTRRNPVPALPLSVALETGSMLLTVAELSALRNEDILLPTTYSGCRGELCLRPAPGFGIRCAVDKGRATVLGFEHTLPQPTENETRRKEMADTAPDAAAQENSATPAPRTPADQAAPMAPADQSAIQNPAAPTAHAAKSNAAISPQSGPDLDALEITVTFELERRLMSIAEIAAMTPGYTFSLAADMNGPVTLRANGKALGTGRLVDVGGVLGVQLIRLEQE